MTDKATDVSVEAEATRLGKKLQMRGEVAWVCGIVLHGCLEWVRLIYWPNADKFSLFGLLIPFWSLACLLAMVSFESMKSTLKERGYSGESTQRKQTIALLIQSQDEEGLRLVRGIATASAVYAFVLGMVMAGLARTYFFDN